MTSDRTTITGQWIPTQSGHNQTTLATLPPATLKTPQPVPQRTRDAAVEYVLRIHFAQQILADLNKLQRHSQTPAAAMYAESLLSTIREMRDLLPVDPYLDVALALYDALIYNNYWADYNAEQYQGALRIMHSLAIDEHLGDSRVEQAMQELRSLGFDTFPFEITFDEETNPGAEDDSALEEAR